ncbi:MAG: YcaO-like family protein [Candidatus Pacebacteria bacterium]|nr:YcaO-like family protein [Candidatus Paceibacterota bacterium]
MKKAYPQTKKDSTPGSVRLPVQAFAPWSRLTVVDRYAVLDSLNEPSTRFTLPLTFHEKMLLRLSLFAKKFDVLERSSVFRASTLAPHWNIILQFLHREGVVRTPEFSRPLFPNDRPKFPSIMLTEGTGASTRGGREVSVYGFGAAGTYEEAISKAIGELLERFSLAKHDRRAFFSSSIKALRQKSARFLDPASLPAFADWQKEAGVNTYTEESKFAWVTATQVRTGVSVYVPAQLVFWNYDTLAAKEPTLGYHTTNGGGGFFSREGAYLSAIYETIQRDGFLIYWLNSLSPAVIDVAAASSDYPELATMLDYLERYHIHPIFLNTTSDLAVPSLICVIVDTNGKEPLITIGGGTGFDFESMALSALYEAVSVNKSRYGSVPFVLPADYQPFTDKSIKRNERLSMWQGKEFVERFNFFITGAKQSVHEFMGEPQMFVGEKEELAHLVSLLEGAGYPVYGYEVRDAVVQKLGYHVVKAIIPGLIPLYLQENLALLGAERLKTVPEKIGYRSAKELNPWPHPFP